MIKRKDNPDFLNAFLDYSATILNKSPNSIKEYNYDLSRLVFRRSGRSTFGTMMVGSSSSPWAGLSK